MKRAFEARELKQLSNTLVPTNETCTSTLRESNKVLIK